MTIMATMLSIVCNFSVGTCGKDHSITPQAEQAIREWRQLLEDAGVRVLEVGLVPSTNYVNFVIEASGLQAAKKAFIQEGIPIDESGPN